jgi:hypothetical protein
MRKKTMIGVNAAAQTLGVNRRTIQYACKRLGVGTQVAVGTMGRFVLLFTAAEVEFLDANLQRRPGRPCTKPNKSKRKKRRLA